MKTHCKRGHPRIPENLYGQGCKICINELDTLRRRKAGALSREDYTAIRRANRKTHCDAGHLLDPKQHGCKVCEKISRASARKLKPMKTHCKNGHPRNPENLDKTGGCKACQRESEKRKWKAGATERQAQKMIKKSERNKPWIDASTGKIVSLCRRQTLTAAGWTQEMVDTTALEQDNRCAICRQVPKIPKNTLGHPGLCADHAHVKPPEPRGLLCNNCNALIGFAKDNPEVCRAAADYLEAWS